MELVENTLEISRRKGRKTMTLHEAALAYARRGKRLFPVHWLEEGRCSCGSGECSSPAKHPLTPHGYKDASCDPSQIEEWWHRWPNANIGMPTGRVNGLVVLDIDPRSCGHESFYKLQEQNQRLPETAHYKTGGGGDHFLFEYPDNGDRIRSRTGFLRGIDICSDGSYVIVPPSVHASGEPYKTIDRCQPAALPSWLLDSIQDDQNKKVLRITNREEEFSIVQGRRNTELASIAGGLRRVGSGLETIKGALLLVNTERCRPPLPEAEVLGIAHSISRYEPEFSDTPESHEKQEEKCQNQAEKLIELADEAEIFRDPDSNAWATFDQETWGIRSRQFKHWLSMRFWSNYSKPASGSPLKDALDFLEARARYSGSTHKIHTRVAGLSGKIYLDLANAAWQVIEISKEGWRVLDESPVKFRRTAGMRPLPVPVQGGSLNDLKPILNYGTSDNFILLVAWLLCALHPTGPYLVLLIYGEQGSAKTSQARHLRAVIDPAKAPLRTSPRNERDLVIAARNARVIVLDNLSQLPQWLSDALCRLSTGGGLSTRRLYTDDEEEIFDDQCPVCLTAIESIVDRPDLVDRAMILELPQIPQDQRRTEQDLQAEFERILPGVLGALLDAIVAGLNNYSEVQLKSLPRMADAAKWIVACESALPWPKGEFMRVYQGNREHAVEATLDADPLASAVRALMQGREDWEGTPTELLRALDQVTDEPTKKLKSWPKAANWLSRKLRPPATFLRSVGIDIQLPDQTTRGSQRIIRIIKRPQNTVDTADTVDQIRISHEINNLQHPSCDDRTDATGIPSALEPVSTAAFDGNVTIDDKKQPFFIDSEGNEGGADGSGEIREGFFR